MATAEVINVPTPEIQAPPESCMIAAEDLWKTYDMGSEQQVHALRGVNLRIQRSEYVAIMGPSGSGKSTLMNLIGCLDTPTKGQYYINGNLVSDMTDDELARIRNKEIGFVFQDATLLPWASATDNVFLPLRLRGLSRDTAMPQVHEALHRVGLDGFEAARPRQLSGGMRMRVSIARALVTRPRLLLMDEPFAALDEFTRHKLQEDLLSLWQDLQCTVVFVTHSIYEAAFLARRYLPQP